MNRCNQTTNEYPTYTSVYRLQPKTWLDMCTDADNLDGYIVPMCGTAVSIKEVSK